MAGLNIENFPYGQLGLSQVLTDKKTNVLNPGENSGGNIIFLYYIFALWL